MSTGLPTPWPADCAAVGQRRPAPAPARRVVPGQAGRLQGALEAHGALDGAGPRRPRDGLLNLQAYHTATSHSLESVRSGRHVLDWPNQPLPFKIYTSLEPRPLP